MKWLILALQLVPHIVTAVKAVESSVPASGSGATKKGIIMGAITSAAQVGEQVPDKTTQLVSSLIDATVKQLNDSGEFTSKTAVPVS